MWIIAPSGAAVDLSKAQCFTIEKRPICNIFWIGRQSDIQRIKYMDPDESSYAVLGYFGNSGTVCLDVLVTKAEAQEYINQLVMKLSEG